MILTLLLFYVSQSQQAFFCDGPLRHGVLRGRGNFIIWYCEMAYYLEAIKLGNTFTDQHVDRDKVNLAMELIRFYMNNSERAIIADCLTPNQAFRRLCNTYYPNTLVNHALIRSEIHIAHLDLSR